MRTRDMFFGAPGGRLFARIWDGRDAAADRAPIILLHDSLGCVDVWRDFPSELAAATGRAVIAYDRLGFGRSDPHPGVLDVDFIRDEARTGLAALLRALRIDRMILFGHSVGGAMAVAAGATFPAATEAVITEAAQAFVEERTLTGVAEARQVMRAPDQIARLARYHGEKARWVLDAWTETWLSPDFADWSLDDDLERLHCPILAIHGDRDEYGSPAFPQRIGALPPTRTRVLIVEDCGHVPHRERPEIVLKAVGEWLADLG